MADTFKVTLSARIRGTFSHTFVVKKQEFYAWLEDYKPDVDTMDPDNDWEELVGDFCEGYWDELTYWPDSGTVWDYDDEKLVVEDELDLSSPLPHEVQLHQETKLW